MLASLHTRLRQGAITRAVLGELPPGEEAALRAHLAGCAACRRAYDRMALVQGALSATGQGAADRARDRLRAALAASPRPAAAARADRRRWIAVALLPAAAAGALVLLARGRDRDEEIAWRGGAGEEAAGPSLVLYASRKPAGGGTPGPVRVLGRLPGSGEARVSLADYLQLGYAGLGEPAHLTVIGVHEAGYVYQFFPRAGAAAEALPRTQQARSLRPSVDLAVAHRPGRMVLFAIFSPAPLAPERARAAAERWQREGRAGVALALPGRQLTGVLQIEP
jgi:hypothetical protein